MPTKLILPGQGDTMNVMSPLIPFNTIVDTDFGLLCLVKQRYLDESVFDKQFFEGKSVKSLTRDLYLRKEKNPLLLCIKDNYRESADKFYSQFMEREYNSILNLSVVTEFYGLARLYSNEPEIKVTILCNTEEEISLLSGRESMRKCKFVLKSDMNEKKYGMHKQYFFKYYEDIEQYLKILFDKTLYFVNYSFNIDILSGDSIDLLHLISNNNIRIIDMYNL